MPATAQGLANAITAAQGPAENTTIQNDANLKLATGIMGYFLSVVKVATGIPVATAGGPTNQVGATTAPGTLV